MTIKDELAIPQSSAPSIDSRLDCIRALRFYGYNGQHGRHGHYGQYGRNGRKPWPTESTMTAAQPMMSSLPLSNHRKQVAKDGWEVTMTTANVMMKTVKIQVIVIERPSSFASLLLNLNDGRFVYSTEKCQDVLSTSTHQPQSSLLVVILVLPF